MAGRPAVAQESLLVTQVDASRLLATQTVRLYVDAPAIADPARLQAGLSVSESADGTTWLERPILSVARDRNRDEGISFFFLLDNSGSMWDNLAGQATDDPASQRIAHARQAIETFLTSVSEVDRVGMAIFNSRYWQVQACAPTVAGISRALQEIGRPEAEDAYTELYGSADLALRGFGESGRRKVLIVLSDGENYPYFTHRHEASPQFGETLALPDELAETASLEGISLYSVRLGPERDDAIGRVASSSGGRVFDAANRADMESIYHEIRRRVLAEYTVSYRAAMLAGGKRHVRLVWRPAAGQTAGAPAGQAERFYFAGNILGASGWQPAWYHPLFFILPLLAILALILFRLEKESDRAGLRLLYGFKGMSTKIFNLDSPQTIIGGAANADITIAGNPSLAGQHATILFDDKAGTYTVVGGGELTVNNQTVIKKKLEPGDVINMAGTVVVFDDKLAGTKSTKGKTRP
ncbi:MAG: hypothetical protein A2087_14710 [Spirochaetes bacterium GWD1_61_31]|nr:MAG: hypothetical protein A2Y37_12945 [Spirochaetes bacterium GWB1_60_80]OHD28692.1 MAG: hypothetical protein A2004_05895 [Spirochaetes bacterium GWC1_61_12]OHD38907.1 MAG: hypothetical protein A2087_14710 [Spirochaetes bacterium GWD1_61_31]OHD43340.1 MAG: hypothetical protein A2Y35_08640 [Spirochaetes bacterium GWE1_60_18]OHD58882.1 MAG: hypothetical protein A2Y32_09010 [Spirochaetes bacterium GWF1_60_12]